MLVEEIVMSRRRRLPPDARVIRVPEDMGALTATTTDTRDGHPVLFWSGLRAVGRVVHYTTLATAAFFGDKRVLVEDDTTPGLWYVAEILHLVPDPCLDLTIASA